MAVVRNDLNTAKIFDVVGRTRGSQSPQPQQGPGAPQVLNTGAGMQHKPKYLDQDTLHYDYQVRTISGSMATIDVKYNDKTGEMKGQITMESWIMANESDQSHMQGQYADTPDKRVVIKIDSEKKSVLDGDDFNSIMADPFKKAARAEKMEEILKDFITDLGGLARTDSPAPSGYSSIRSRQREELLFKPDKKASKGLFLIVPQQEIRSIKVESPSKKDQMRESLEKTLIQCNKELQKDGDSYRLRFVVPKKKLLERILDDIQSSNSSFIRSLAPAVKYFAKFPDRTRVKIKKYLHGLRRSNSVKNSRLLKNLIDKASYYFEKKSELFDRAPDGLPKLTFFGKDKFLRGKIYDKVSDCATVISSWNDSAIEKYQVDPNGQELKHKWRTAIAIWLYNKTFGFVFDGCGATGVQKIVLQKDDDMCRLQLFAGKQISGFKKWWRFNRRLHFWNHNRREGNNSFVELAIGEPRHDPMHSTIQETKRLLKIFAHDHKYAKPGRDMWKTSYMLNALLTACDPKRSEIHAEKGMSFIRPKSLGILNIHFSKIANVLWEAAPVGCHWSACNISNSEIVGSFSGATFVNCKIGDGLLSWLFLGRKTEIYFAGDGFKGPADYVEFRNSTVTSSTNFFGGINDGHFIHSFFSMSHFSADCTSMDSFGVSPRNPFFTGLRFFNSKFDKANNTVSPYITTSSTATLVSQIPMATAFFSWWLRLRKTSPRKIKDMVEWKEDHFSKQAQKQLYVRKSQWVPNTIMGSGHRLSIAASLRQEVNNGVVEVLFYDHALGMHFLNCVKPAAKFRVINADLSVAQAPKIAETGLEALGLIAEFRASAMSVEPKDLYPEKPK